MKTNRTLALLLTATLFAAAFAGCIGEDEAEDTTETVKIGFLNPQTGPLEADAPGFSWGVAQAIDDLNAMPGDVVFEAVEVNSGCDGTVGSTGAQTLVDSGVVAVVGAACSGDAQCLCKRGQENALLRGNDAVVHDLGKGFEIGHLLGRVLRRKQFP